MGAITIVEVIVVLGFGLSCDALAISDPCLSKVQFRVVLVNP